MAETIPGGAYLAEDGTTWHDAHGNKLSKEQVKDAEAVLTEKAEKNEAAEQAALEARTANLIGVQLIPAQAVAKIPVKSETGKGKEKG